MRARWAGCSLDVLANACRFGPEVPEQSASAAWFRALLRPKIGHLSTRKPKALELRAQTRLGPLPYGLLVFPGELSQLTEPLGDPLKQLRKCDNGRAQFGGIFLAGCVWKPTDRPALLVGART